MNVLAVDTSGPVCGVAIADGERVLYEAAAVNRFTHSVNLMPMVDQALAHTGLALSDINLLAAVTGPGSFTGVRIGVSTVKGLAHGAGLPCVGVDALEALALSAGDAGALLCPLQDARAGQVYGAAFRPGLPPVRLMEDAALPLQEYLARALALADAGQPLCFVGDGAAAYRDAILAALPGRAVFPPAHHSYLRPAAAALLALARQDEAGDYLALMPRYLRAPQAERARQARSKAVEP